ncbi:hypothetical protein BH11ACT3_BH11ACT3_12510 [soil metagenome]
MSDEISVAIDEVLEAIKQLTVAHDFLPEPGDVAQTDGPATGHSQSFRAELNSTARQFSTATQAIRDELISMQQAIQHTSEQLLQQDDSIASDLSAVSAELDAAAIPVTPSTAPLTKAPSVPAVAPSAANQIG